jgi:hypothetical protein
VKSIAYFISPHGFGHAARSSAIMAALHHLDPYIRFEIYTLIPEWFFAESLTGCYHYHSLKTDIGLIQKSPLSEDAEATLYALDQFLPFPQDLIKQVAQNLTENRCLYAICDISPLGILAGKTAGLATVLIENFTWDWIYENYLQDYPGFSKHISYLRRIFQTPDVHILAQPFCQSNPHADLIARPISRPRTNAPKAVRAALGISEEEKMILITMGGIPESFQSVEHLHEIENVVFIIPGGNEKFSRSNNLILLPHHSDFYHPNLINSCDAAIGKAGYSTIAELYNSGIPFGYFSRDSFRESAFLTTFINANMPGIELNSKQITDPEWLAQIPELLSLPHAHRDQPNGAVQVAEYLLQNLP